MCIYTYESNPHILPLLTSIGKFCFHRDLKTNVVTVLMVQREGRKLRGWNLSTDRTRMCLEDPNHRRQRM